MSYAFPPDLAALVDRQMKLRGYQSQDEVLRAALAALAALEESNKEIVVGDPVVIAGIRQGLEEIKAGLGIPFEEFDAQLRAEFGIADDA